MATKHYSLEMRFALSFIPMKDVVELSRYGSHAQIKVALL